MVIQHPFRAICQPETCSCVCVFLSPWLITSSSGSSCQGIKLGRSLATKSTQFLQVKSQAFCPGLVQKHAAGPSFLIHGGEHGER